MNILQQIHTILEDRGNGPTVPIMLTQKQATELYNTIHRIIALENNKECYNCGFNDEDYGCTCPHTDKWYACPIENKKPENVKALEEY